MIASVVELIGIIEQLKTLKVVRWLFYTALMEIDWQKRVLAWPSFSKIKLLHPVNGHNELLTLDSMDSWNPLMQGRCKILKENWWRTTTWILGRKTEKHKLADLVSWGNSVTHLGMSAWLLWAQRDIFFWWHSLQPLKGWITWTDGKIVALLLDAPKII